MVIILVDRITNRLVYTFDFAFNARGVDYRMITDPVAFNDSEGVKFNYSTHDVKCASIVPLRPWAKHSSALQSLSCHNRMHGMWPPRTGRWILCMMTNFVSERHPDNERDVIHSRG